MKICYGEIWEFVEKFHAPDSFRITLCVGKKRMQNIACEIICDMRKDAGYDSDLLNVIFSEKEVFWDPNRSPDPRTYVIQLKVVEHTCEEIVETFKKRDAAVAYIYAEIMAQLLKTVQTHRERVGEQGRIDPKGIGDFRCDTLPFFSFFIGHPKTKKNDQREALRKFSHMVESLMTGMNRQLHQIEMAPYWEIEKATSTKKGGEGANPPPKG